VGEIGPDAAEAVARVEAVLYAAFVYGGEIRTVMGLCGLGDNARQFCAGGLGLLGWLLFWVALQRQPEISNSQLPIA